MENMCQKIGASKGLLGNAKGMEWYDLVDKLKRMGQASTGTGTAGMCAMRKQHTLSSSGLSSARLPCLMSAIIFCTSRLSCCVTTNMHIHMYMQVNTWTAKGVVR